ncbi:MAG: sigma-70 family RNA polymerase sigma factor [Planctomycetota bacterium]
MQRAPSDPSPDSDASDAIVRSVIAGEPGAWKNLIGLWSRRVYAAAQSRLHDPEAAEEVTQSVMVTVYEQISAGRYAHNGQFESWLLRIAMNRVRDVVRKSQRQRTRSLGDAAGAASDERPPVSQYEAPDPMTALREAIASLPDADQEVLSLRHHAQLGFAAIAEMLGQPVGTVLARHHRAVAKLKSQLESHPFVSEAQR